MGLIAQRLAPAETRSVSDWLNDDEDAGVLTAAGVRVNAKSALTVSTVMRCVEILSAAVGGAPRDVILKVRGQSFPEYSNVPSWVDTPNPAQPLFTGDDYIKQIATSFLFDGNYFVRAWPDRFAPSALQPLDPAFVRVKEPESGPGPVLEVLDQLGHIKETLLPHQYLHGKWITMPGQLRAVSRLEQMRRAVGGAIAAEDHAARFFGQGAALSFGVEVPYAMDPVKKEELREHLKARYAGRSNSHAIGVLTDGAKFVPGMAPTPEQAQMLETRKFSVEDIARIFGVPPYMVGSQEPGAASYASSQTSKLSFGEHTLLPLASAIESQHNLLLLTSPVPGGKLQFRLNLDHLLRADLLSRYQAYEAGVRGGFLKPDEARGKEDLGPVPGGDRIYMQAQMTPIEMLGKEPAAPVPTRTEPPVIVNNIPEQRNQPEEVHYHFPAASPVEVHNHVAAAEAPIIHVAAPEVRNEIRLPEQPAPVVTVAPPEIRVDVAAAMPTVNVTTPDTIRIAEMPVRVTTRRVTKRTDKGIDETTDVETDA